MVGIASTIDNDLCGSEITIGVDTALNIALEAIDRHQGNGFIARARVFSGSNGARLRLPRANGGHCGRSGKHRLPEVETDPETVAMDLREAYERGKAHAIVVVAEGAKYNAEALTTYFREHHERLGFELRVIKLGHVQRGGAPGAFDRLLGTRMGAAATEHVARGEFGLLVGLCNNQMSATPLAAVAGKKKAPDLRLFDLANILAR